MCLAIPGQIVDVTDEANRLAQVDVAGVRRNVNIGLLDADGGGAGPGDWVLIHVGFAISKVDEQEAEATQEAPRRHGCRLRAGAGGTEGERYRVTSTRAPASVPDRDPHCDPEDGCVTCGDVAVPMRILALDASRGLALCATERDQRETVEIALVGPVAIGDELLVHAGTAIAAWKIVPPVTATPPDAKRRSCCVEIRRRVSRRRARPRARRRDPVDGRAGPPLQADGGVRRAHPLDLQVRDRRPAPRRRRARPRAGVPGVRDPDGPGGRRHGDRPRRTA